MNIILPLSFKVKFIFEVNIFYIIFNITASNMNKMSKYCVFKKNLFN